MTLLNKIFEVGRLTKNELETYISLLCPFAPHICEEMWEQLGHSNLLSLSAWPSYDDSLTVSETVEYVLQINGKLKSKIKLPAGTDETSAIEAALKDEKIAEFTEGKQIVKKIFVPGKIINFVVR